MRKLINIIENSQMPGSATERMLWSLVEFEIVDVGELQHLKIIAQHARELISFFLKRGYKYEWGSKRITLIGDRYVYKIPRDYSGIRANMMEARYYKRKEDEKLFPVAACKIVYFNKDVGLPVLMMEKVEPIGGELPDWANWVDGGQVGRTRKGDIVAYDI